MDKISFSNERTDKKHKWFWFIVFKQINKFR